MQPASRQRPLPLSPDLAAGTAKRLVAALLLGLLPILCAATLRSSSAADWLRGEELASARRALERGDIESARFALVTLSARDPESLRARYALVFTRLRLGELDFAHDEAERAVDAYPTKGYAWAALGMARIHLADFAGAEAALEEAVPRWRAPAQSSSR